MLDEKDVQAIAQLMDAKLAQQKKEIMNEVKFLLDTEVKTQFKLLAEGQKTILETLAPKSRVEALEDEMVFIKQVIKSLSKEVSELKKAN